MTLNPPTHTHAVIHRAGPYTTLVVLPDWYNGQILCPVPTADILAATGPIPLADLPGVELHVLAHLDAHRAEGLACVGWDIVRPPAADMKKALTPEGGRARVWAGSQGGTVPSTRWAA